MKSLAFLCVCCMLLLATVAYSNDGDLIAVDNNGSEYFRVEGDDGTVTITGNIEVGTDNSYDLGASGAEFKDLYIDGTANIDAASIDSATLTAATVTGRALVLASGTTQQVIYAATAASTSGDLAVTFSTAFSAAPICTATTHANGTTDISVDATTTGVTFTSSAGGSEKISYICVGAK